MRFDNDTTYYVGSIGLKFVLQNQYQTREHFARWNVEPPNSLVANPLLPNHDISACDDNIYPRLYGHSSIVQSFFFGMD